MVIGQLQPHWNSPLCLLEIRLCQFPSQATCIREELNFLNPEGNGTIEPRTFQSVAHLQYRLCYIRSKGYQLLWILTFCWPCISVYLSQCLTNLMHKICLTISFISCLYMFRVHVLIIRRSKLHYTASGVITRVWWHQLLWTYHSSVNILETVSVQAHWKTKLQNYSPVLSHNLSSFSLAVSIVKLLNICALCAVMAAYLFDSIVTLVCINWGCTQLQNTIIAAIYTLQQLNLQDLLPTFVDYNQKFSHPRLLVVTAMWGDYVFVTYPCAESYATDCEVSVIIAT